MTFPAFDVHYRKTVISSSRISSDSFWNSQRAGPSNARTATGHCRNTVWIAQTQIIKAWEHYCNSLLSVLFATNKTGFLVRRKMEATCKSKSVTPFITSTTNRITSLLAMEVELQIIYDFTRFFRQTVLLEPKAWQPVLREPMLRAISELHQSFPPLSNSSSV